MPIAVRSIAGFGTIAENSRAANAVPAGMFDEFIEIVVPRTGRALGSRRSGWTVGAVGHSVRPAGIAVVRLTLPGSVAPLPGVQPVNGALPVGAQAPQ